MTVRVIAPAECPMMILNMQGLLASAEMFLEPIHAKSLSACPGMQPSVRKVSGIFTLPCPCMALSLMKMNG